MAGLQIACEPRPIRSATAPLLLRLYVLNISQKQLATELKISYCMLSRCEMTGKLPKKYRETYQRIAKQRGRFIPSEWFDVFPLPEIPEFLP